MTTMSSTKVRPRRWRRTRAPDSVRTSARALLVVGNLQALLPGTPPGEIAPIRHRSYRECMCTYRGIALRRSKEHGVVACIWPGLYVGSLGIQDRPVTNCSNNQATSLECLRPVSR